MRGIAGLLGQSFDLHSTDALDECLNDTGTPSAREEVLDLVLWGLETSNIRVCIRLDRSMTFHSLAVGSCFDECLSS